MKWNWKVSSKAFLPYFILIHLIQCISVSELPEVPVGTILSWVVKVDNNGGEIASLPDGWLRCDGSTIPAGSIWAGKTLPNLNGERRFLRGGSDSDVLTMEEAQMESHDHSVSASASVHDSGHTHTTTYHHECRDDACDDRVWQPAEHPDWCKDDWYECQDFTSHSSHSGISVDVSVDVGSVTGASTGSETRPKNMNVIYVMRVW